ncbi:UDP-2-acetamido-3-amino-2,3-dideoxy-glucuronate N-acetyltransferase [Cnuella takakiae]|uniref:UDP-2-acetamido-3-amino-2,3-dideoxy-glucuronate N-acetyltransferase n=1 Tax=Cnuella takakiae TaxID=1302690 RepID=A0A1M5DQG5_9BACT|nr:acyltransferase [Cnuella takakiae]OLY93903.1 N-acetyltransferase [Cnuella takakiae]SHF69278.1 UDP-2-acetamido-3-amino-2,3-dideoxy-glucuronate N-acetyltransferase [Cnuella takakiae]
MEQFQAHPTAVIDPGAEIGAGTQIWHFCHLMTGCRIGEGCNLGQNVFVDRQVVVGNRVKVQNNVSLYQGVLLEDEVFVGPSVVFTNVINPRSFIERKQEFRQTVVERGATIGANATIVCGVRIGAYAFVGAGSVVTKSVKPYALVRGNPARHVGWVGRGGNPLLFNDLGLAACSLTGEQYRIDGGDVFLVG